jgi:hypothetical protein
MMSYASIVHLNAQIARKSVGVRPKQALVDGQIDHVPNIGRVKRFKGLRVTNTYFVDKTGMGSAREAALTIDAFQQKVIAGRYYAVTEEGPFQVYVTEWEARQS